MCLCYQNNGLKEMAYGKEEVHTRLSPRYIVVTTAAFIVAIGWSNFFNTLFENVASRYDKRRDGPVELALRFSFAAVLTTVLILAGYHWRRKHKEKRKRKEQEIKNLTS